MHTQHDVLSHCKIYTYPHGVQDFVAADRAIFKADGWEERKHKDDDRDPPVSFLRAYLSLFMAVWCGYMPILDDAEEERREAQSVHKSMCRARSKLRRLALANDFRWFVTLTLDQRYVDRMDSAAVVRKLSTWCSNMVQRRGLRYILVPERHKRGGIHFHGFFSDCDLGAVLSGHKDKQGHDIYNLDRWDLGFTTAIELYGDYPSAVAYVCKYIGKDGEKIGGRWYYSGGGLVEPKTDYADISARDLEQMFENSVGYDLPGRRIVVVNGVKTDGES